MRIDIVFCVGDDGRSDAGYHCADFTAGGWLVGELLEQVSECDDQWFLVFMDYYTSRSHSNQNYHRETKLPLIR